jgi:predicted Fe-Mo cluster-binding NifX family protein
MKRIAIPVSWHQVATVLDYSSTFLLLALDGDTVRGQLEIPVDREAPEGIARLLEAFHADVVICGAVSRSLLESLGSRGIEVITRVRGPLKSVVDAYIRGTLAGRRFRLPGASDAPGCLQAPSAGRADG